MGNIFSGLLGKQGSSEQQPDAAGQSVGDTGADGLFSQLNERITSLENRIDRLEEELRQLSKREQQSADVPKVDSKDNELTMPVYGQQRQLFLAAPTTDGVFSHASPIEQIGKSIYQLTTIDGVNGSFILLDTPDAIATAMISVSQFIKPVCKVGGNVSGYPRHIITEEEGTAVKEGEHWKMMRKAQVRFE